MPTMVTLETDGPVALVTLNRPEALNAISGSFADQLTAAFREVGSRPDLWVMVLRAAGDRGFCVGADLKERATFSLEDFHVNRKQVRGMFHALRSLPQPTIASVFGFALGGGFELALSCDLVVAAEDAIFGLPEARVGLVPAGGGTQLLPRLVGPARAKELIFTGRRFGAEEARSMGLIARVVARDDLDAATVALAFDICGSSPVAVREAKRAIDATLGTSLEEGIEIEHAAWEQVRGSGDRAEGIAAFNEKREPRWGNR
jgi:enoyl-CoA hydratase/carnithine racemase